MQSPKNPRLKELLLLGLVLFLAWGAAGVASAQEPDVKPIRLVTGEIIPAKIAPAQVRVAPEAVFDGHYFKLVQFAQIPDAAARQRLQAEGLHLIDYLPDNTYYAVIERTFGLDQVADQAVTVIDVPDAVRLDPRLASLSASGKSSNRLVVSYYATLDAGKIIADLRARGASIEQHRDYSRQLDIVIDPARFTEIIGLPYLQFLGLPPEEPVLEGYDHRNATGRANYLNTGYNGLNYNAAGVVVGIGEGGTVDDLKDVKGRLTEMVSGSPSDHKIGVMQNSGGGGNLDPSNRNNAWGATFLSVESYPNYASLFSSNNLRYTNHSYGTSGPAGGYDQTARDHDLRIASYPTHLVIYSSGNSGASTGFAPYAFPTWSTITGASKHNKNMLSIGALEPDDDLASFSSRGPLIDGRIAPQMVIEGIEGTSDAAPKMTGIIAIMAQVYKDKNGSAEPASSLLRAVLMNTADDVDDPGPDYKTGFGRPNVRRAYNVINNAQFLTDAVSNGETDSRTINVPANTKQMRVMLVWPDVAASVNANPAIVNNLNLVAKDPSNTSYHPWVLDSTPSQAAIDAPATRGVDNLNTIEQVTVDDPPAGDWTIEISGATVPFGPQTYYLTYELLGDELRIAFPLKDHRFVSGGIYHLKWDSYGASGTFSLDYQLDGGTWTSIATGYSAPSRTYQWTAPSVTGIHTIKFRVQRGALTSESDVNYIGGVPQELNIDWACGGSVKLTWIPVSGATAYKVYKLGAQYMEEVTSGVAFDGASAILTGQSTTENEYYAVSAVTGAYEGLRTMALVKPAGDYQCYNVKTVAAASVDKTDITLRGAVNPHGSTLTDVHFEYGPTTAYGSSTPNIAISASGDTEEAVSYALASTLSSRTDVLHHRLVATKDGSTVYGDDQETRLAPGNDFTFDGVDDYINVSDHLALPIYRSGAGTGYSIAMWVKGSPTSGAKLYCEAASSGSAMLSLQTHTSGLLWVYITDDSGATLKNVLVGGTLLDNTWHHLVWVDENGTIKVYIDGAQSGTTSYTPSTMSLDRSAIGARYDTDASNFYTGRIDEVSLWDKALTLAEIRDLMHQPLQGAETNLKAHYQLDNASSHAYDLVTGKEAEIGGGGSATSATAPDGVGVEYTATEAAGAVTWSGTGMSANYSGQTGKTVIVSRIDVEPNTTGGITGNVNVLDNQYWVVHQHATGSFSANVTFTVSEDLTASDETSPAGIQLYSRVKGSDGNWSLVTTASAVSAAGNQATFSGITTFNQQFILVRHLDPLLSVNPSSLAFKNCKVGCNQQLSYVLSGAHLTADVVVTPPAGFLVSTDGSTFVSSLTLSPAGGTLSQTIYVRFAASTVGVYSGNITHSSTGVTTVSVSIPQFEVLAVADTATNAMVFNGSTQYLDVQNFNWNPASIFTVEWWLKPSTGANYNQTIGNGWNAWVFHANNTAYFSSGVANDGNSRIDSAAGALTLNEWQHFAYVLNGANARLYRNGELVGEKTNSTPFNSTWTHFMIGAINSNTINGQLDEFRIWSVARTQQQIRDDMHNVLTGNEAGLKLYLQFNAASGAAEDFSSNFYVVETYNNPTRTTSTAPVGTGGEFVNTQMQTATGDTGKQLKATITSMPDAMNYLGIYRTGDGTSRVTSGESFPSGVTQRASIYWGVHEYGSVTADLVIDYSNVPGINVPAAMQLLKRTDATSAWTNVTGDFTHDTANRTFSKSGMTDFSEFAIGDNGQNPLAVMMSAFETQAAAEGILVTWETMSEIGNAGFNLYRIVSPAGTEMRLNATLIPSQVPGGAGGAAYDWLDESCVPETTYDYWLETVGLDGQTTRHGPATGTCGAPTAVSLRELRATGITPAVAALATLAGAIAALVILRDRLRFDRRSSHRTKRTPPA